MKCAPKKRCRSFACRYRWVIYILFDLFARSVKLRTFLLAVPFRFSRAASTSCWFLNYNFSVAVWVGLSRSFGTAVQTTVVMVI